jgi:enoyl-CoA hydratase/carnithine racemase
MLDSSRSTVSVERDGHLLLIGVDRQLKRNAWDVEVIALVARALTELRDDDSLRVGVIFGHGPDFTAGLDLASVAPVIAAGEGDSILPAEMCDPWDFLGEPCPKPVVVAVQGRCFTLGIELILASQLAVAADDTVFAQLEVARGILPLGGGTWRLPARLGTAGMRYLLSAEQFDAAEALRIGLVNEVVPVGSHLERAVALADEIAANAPLGVQASLAAARASVRAARDAAAAHLRAEGVSILNSADALEGLASLIERRPPIFIGC